MKELFLNQTLKRKWALTSSAVIFISYAMICFVIYIALQTWLLNNEESSVKRTSDDLTAFLLSQGPNVTIQEIQQNTGLMNSIVDKKQTVRLFNTDGIEILRINDTVPAASFEQKWGSKKESHREKVNDLDVLVESKTISLGLFKGYLQVVHPLTDYHAMLNYVLTAMLIGGLGALILSASIGYALANVLIRPIYELRDSMAKVKENGFDAPIELVYRANDEIGELLSIYHAMMSELQIAFTQQQQFVEDASHELRTPIQSLEGHLSMLKRWGKDDPLVLAESLDTSLHEIRRMKKLIEELLEMARREQRDIEARASISIVGEQIKNELLLVYPDCSILTTYDKDLEDIFITANALGQILRNIIENAIRYCNQIPHIEMRAFKKGDFVVIEISDNGIGIAEEELKQIFDRFYRIDKVRNRNDGGTGLGLSITKLLIGKYYGNIEVKSEIGKGSVFTIFLPLKK